MAFLGKDIGIDLGTANTLVHVKGKGIIVREPSVIAIDKEENVVLQVGDEAKRMIGRTPGNIIAIRPMQDGVIANIDGTQEMIRHFIKRAMGKSNSVFKPRVMVCIPSGITDVERRAVEESVLQAGAKDVCLIEEPMAAAIGAGLPVDEPAGSMIVDIGGGTTEVAVIALGGIVTSRSIKIAGNALDTSIINFIKREYKLNIGARTAEDIKITIGSAYPYNNEGFYDVRGRDMVSGLPKNISVSAEEIRGAMSENIAEIVEAIKMTLEKTPPELASDIMESGIYLAGGGALIRGLDKLISECTHIPVYIADSPLDCVILGTGKSVDNNMDFLIKNDGARARR